MSMPAPIALFGKRLGTCHRFITEMSFYSVEGREASYNEVVDFASNEEIEHFAFVKGLTPPTMFSFKSLRSLLKDRDYLSDRKEVGYVALQ